MAGKRIKYAKDVRYEFAAKDAHLACAPDNIKQVRLVWGKKDYGSLYQGSVDRMIQVLTDARDKMNAEHPRASADHPIVVDDNDILWVWMDVPETRAQWSERIRTWFRSTNKARVAERLGKTVNAIEAHSAKVDAVREEAKALGFILVKRKTA